MSTYNRTVEYNSSKLLHLMQLTRSLLTSNAIQYNICICRAKSNNATINDGTKTYNLTDGNAIELRLDRLVAVFLHVFQGQITTGAGFNQRGWSDRGALSRVKCGSVAERAHRFSPRCDDGHRRKTLCDVDTTQGTLRQR